MFRVLFVTPKNDWVHRVAQVFRELDLQIQTVETFAAAQIHQQQSSADVIVFDLSLANSADPVEEAKRIAASSRIVLLAPPEFVLDRSELSNSGIQVLTKPITAGEVGLALSRAKRLR